MVLLQAKPNGTEMITNSNFGNTLVIKITETPL